jgi:hypothetical protein
MNPQRFDSYTLPPPPDSRVFKGVLRCRVRFATPFAMFSSKNSPPELHTPSNACGPSRPTPCIRPDHPFAPRRAPIATFERTDAVDAHPGRAQRGLLRKVCSDPVPAQKHPEVRGLPPVSIAPVSFAYASVASSTGRRSSVWPSRVIVRYWVRRLAA